MIRTPCQTPVNASVVLFGRALLLCFGISGYGSFRVPGRQGKKHVDKFVLARVARRKTTACHVSAVHIREKSWPPLSLVFVQPNHLSLASFSIRLGLSILLFSLKNALVVCLVHSFYYLRNLCFVTLSFTTLLEKKNGLEPF
ncbi:hypothetical protein F5Y17DRAFT_414266, partial [Xylariaceae sp. FL0594]